MRVSMFRVALLIHLVLDTINTDALEAHTFVYVTRGERKIKDTYILDQHALRSKLECTTKCTISPACTGVSWTSLDKKCLLTSGDTAEMGYNNECFEAAANWQAMIKIMYPESINRVSNSLETDQTPRHASFHLDPNCNSNHKFDCRVAHYVGPSGRYTLTFNEARSLCEQENTTVASPADLLHARSLGYQKCSCGWVSNGTNMLVMQKHYPGCWNPITVCGFSLANLYCLVPEYVYP